MEHVSKKRKLEHEGPAPTAQIDQLQGLTNLASDRYGARILFATDDFFSAAEGMLQHSDPVFIPDKYTEFGKWMDGWETRRKRVEGHDWCIVKLGLPGRIRGVLLDTCFFTGNQAPRASIQAACLDEEPVINRPSDKMGTRASESELAEAARIQSDQWEEIMPFTPLGPGYEATRFNVFAINSDKRWTHVRLNIYPDGGVARMRLFGDVAIDWAPIKEQLQVVDLAAVENGGQAVYCSDAHYGKPSNLIGPGRAPNMGDGWETARKKNRPPVYETGADGCLNLPGCDWSVLRLGHKGVLSKIEVDTNHFKGNFPESFILEGCLLEGDGPYDKDYFVGDHAAGGTHAQWVPIIARTKLNAHEQRYFSSADGQVLSHLSINHVKLTIIPDGGVSRLRLWGRPVE